MVGISMLIDINVLDGYCFDQRDDSGAMPTLILQYLDYSK